MRKLIISLFCILLSLSAFAKKDIKASGDLDVLKENAIAQLVVDFSKTSWEYKTDFKTYSEDAYEERVLAATNSFLQSFNTNSNGLKLSEKEEGDYVLTVTVSMLEKHQTLRGEFGQGRIYVTGKVEIKDRKSDAVVCTIYVDKYGKKDDYVIADAMGKTFKGLAQKIIKLKK